MTINIVIMVLVTIDGNIGVGKSSVLMHLHKNNNKQIDLEPIAKWSPYLDKINNIPMLGYNPVWFNFQKIIWEDRAVLQNNSTNIIFYERSPQCTQHTFVEVLKKNGNINTEEYNILMQMYESSTVSNIPNKFIYLRTTPEVCYARMNKRGRDCEDKISLEYLKILHEYHEVFFTHIKNEGYDVTIINAEQSVEDIAQQVLSCI